MASKRTKQTKDENRDPITEEPGAHPVGTGIGAAAGGAAGGAALGAAGAAVEGAIAGTALGGPVGAAIGGVAGVVAGAVGGGLLGKAVAEQFDPTVEIEHWREHYRNRPYVTDDDSFEDYEPAYRYGLDSRSRYADQDYDEIEEDLERDWATARGNSRLDWERARPATRDAWDRIAARQGRPLPKKG
jgi:hypothetical protein